MKKNCKFASRLILIPALLLSWTVASALESFDTAGTIKKIGIGTVSILEQKYWLTPTTNISREGVTNAKLADLKPGDDIFIKGRIIGEKRYADIIMYVPTKNK